MVHKLFDSERKAMELIWAHEPVCAKELSVIAAKTIGWNKNTTYTVLKKLESKGFIRREDPGFLCRSLVSRDTVRQAETQDLIRRLYGGSKKALLSSLLEDESLSAADLEELRRIIETR